MLAIASACGSGSSAELSIEAPAQIERGILKSEAAAQACQARVAEALGQMLPGDARVLAGQVDAKFAGRFLELDEGRLIEDERLQIWEFGRSSRGVADALGWTRALEECTQEWESVARAEFELDRFLLAKSGELATGEAELYLAGELANGAREDWRLRCSVEFRRVLKDWRMSQLEVIGARRVRSELPTFRDVTGAVGLSQNLSRENRDMLQAFVDEHRTLALGGLSAVDWNRDGFWDVIASLDDQISTLFLNDGQGGFDPMEMPIAQPKESPTFWLHVDLDGDGVDELVSSKVGNYVGESASLSLYRRENDGWKQDSTAFRFANQVGRRGISPTTIVPTDIDGDGLLDLFVGVYGNDQSRGEAYNLVEAHDGAKNYLFVQEAPLKFREVSLERGIEGTQYTYVALAHDFEGDGDEDLFEGNDFGPNILWRNDGQGNFSRDEDSVFAGESAYTMGVTLADHDDDGRLSLYVVNMSSESGMRVSGIAGGISEQMRERVRTIASGNQLYTRGKDGNWIEHAQAAGCAEGEWGWGALFCDLDGDGDDEIFATNGFTSHSNESLPDWDPYFWRQVATDGALLEKGELTYDVNEALDFEGSYAGRQRDRLFYAPDGSPERFIDVAWHLGLDSLEDGRCVLPIDMDGDGDLDLVIRTLQGLRCFENRSEPTEFVRLKLRATKSHPLALGARVRVRAAGTTHHEIVQLVEGFQTQVPDELHLSVPGAAALESIEVDWPSGETQRWEDLPVGRRIELTEGATSWGDEAIPAWPATLSSRVSDDWLERVLQIQRLERPTAGRWAVLAFVSGQDEIMALLQGSGDKEGTPLDYRFELDSGRAGLTLLFGQRNELKRLFFGSPSKEAWRAVLSTLKDEEPFPELLVLTGRRLLMDGEVEQAQACYERAIELDPDLANAQEGLARCRREQGDLEGAERAYERSIEIDPDYAIGHYNLGVLKIRTGRAREALDSYREALRIQGERAATLLSFGEAALIAKEFEVALNAFDRAGQAAPQSTKPRLLQAKLFGQLKRYPESQAAFQSALEIDPQNQDAQRGLDLLERLLKDE